MRGEQDEARAGREGIDHPVNGAVADLVRDRAHIELGILSRVFGEWQVGHDPHFIFREPVNNMRVMSGPRPTPRLSRARREVLQRVGDRGGQQVTLADVHDDSHRHPNATRQLLAALTADGFLESAPLPRGTRGRPPLAWSLTTKGRRALAPADETATLVGVLASYLVDRPGPPDAHELGLQWSRAHEDLITENSEQVDDLITVLDALGFDPVHTSKPAGDSVSLRACPLVDDARARPDVVCEMHRGLLDGIIQRLGLRQGVGLVPFADQHGCRVEVSADDTDPSS